MGLLTGQYYKLLFKSQTNPNFLYHFFQRHSEYFLRWRETTFRKEKHIYYHLTFFKYTFLYSCSRCMCFASAIDIFFQSAANFSCSF